MLVQQLTEMHASGCVTHLELGVPPAALPDKVHNVKMSDALCLQGLHYFMELF